MNFQYLVESGHQHDSKNKLALSSPSSILITVATTIAPTKTPDQRINKCDYFDCLNGGTCEPTIDYTDFTCSCQTGFQGRICETKIGTMATLG